MILLDHLEWWHAADYTPGLPIDRQQAVYAECQGPDDPVCGRCRFSVHGCNGGRPSRVEYTGS